MRRLVARVILSASVLACAGAATASPVQAGDWVRFTGSSGTLGGGGFLIDDLTDPNVADFVTFCLQVTQYVNYSGQFLVASITDYADDLAGNDPISEQTAWIMSNFSRGQLAGFSVDDIQWSIWKLEGERATHWGQSAALIALADAAVGGGWANDGVQVLNMFWANGNRAQDQLVYLPFESSFRTTDVVPTPEPSTWLLVGGGVVAVAFARRRRAR